MGSRDNARGVNPLVMVWATVTEQSRNALNFNHWPNPVSWITNIEELACNQNTWIAEITFASAVLADFFWTSFVPSPREIERKALLGNYRCGFVLKVKAKSPIEILFGRGTNKMIVEILNPFLRGIFYWWAIQTSLEALSVWSTLVYSELLCDPPKGNYVQPGVTNQIVTGNVSGVPLGGVPIYDPHGLGGPPFQGCDHASGPTSATQIWLFQASVGTFDDIRVGWQWDGVITDLVSIGSLAPGQSMSYRTSKSQNIPSGGHIAPYFEIDSSGAIFTGAANCLRFIADVVPL